LEVAHLSWQRFGKPPPLVHMPMLAESAEHAHEADEMDDDDVGHEEDCSVVQESHGVDDDAMVLEAEELSDEPTPTFSVDWFRALPAKDGESTTRIVKPIPVVFRPSSLSSSDQRPGLDLLRPVMAPTPLSYRLLEDGSRHSAFHTTASANATVAAGEIDGQAGLPNAISVP
jgi:hypothetical protein